MYSGNAWLYSQFTHRWNIFLNLEALTHLVWELAKIGLTQLSARVFGRLPSCKRSNLRIVHFHLWNDAAGSLLLMWSEHISGRINTLLKIQTNAEIPSNKEDGCPLLLVPLVHAATLKVVDLANFQEWRLDIDYL